MSNEPKTDASAPSAAEIVETPTRDQIVEFLTARGALSPACPICASSGWALGSKIESIIAVHVMQSDMNKPSLLGNTLPVAILHCTNCGFIREHAAMAIGRWVKNGNR